MELREYARIVYRRLWVIVLLFIVVLVASVLLRPQITPTYSASMRFLVGVEPEPRTGDNYHYDKYYTWLTAEYLVDDLAELVKSRAFAEAVSTQMGGNITPGSIQASTYAGKLHRVLTVNVSGSDPETLLKIAEAAAAILPSEAQRHFAQLGTEGVVASLIDPPMVNKVGMGLRQKLDLPVRLFLGLVAGLVLAFTMDYLDESVRGVGEVEALGLRVIAEVPPLRQKGWRRWVRQRLP
ncbi:MAG: hypothetical protein H5T64_05645 [Chloroflexi bacterium]|nr:hypothetical protein [Chloroflexota bacterium]